MAMRYQRAEADRDKALAQAMSYGLIENEPVADHQTTGSHSRIDHEVVRTVGTQVHVRAGVRLGQTRLSLRLA